MRTRNLIAVGLLAVFMGACGGDGPGITEPTTVAGKYVLQTVDGQPLPLVVFDEPGYKLEITYSDLVLSESGTFTNNATWRETDQGGVTTRNEVSVGSYTANGSKISFISPGGDPFEGTLSGNTLTVTYEDEDGKIVGVYRK